MNTKQITAANVDEKIKQLYETAFPEDEQIPWDDLMRLIWEMPLDFTAYYDGEDFIGFTIVYPRKSFNWFWYFAVRDELRGKGYGQQILTQLIERYKEQPFVLDMESTTQVCDNLEERRKRQAFYLRNGFKPKFAITWRNVENVRRSTCETGLRTRMSIVPTTTSP